MFVHRLAAMVLATMVLLSIGGVGTVAATEHHPACEDTKHTISAEGAKQGSKTITKPVCSESGEVEFGTHDPDDDLSIPEGFQWHEHDTARVASPNFDE